MIPNVFNGKEIKQKMKITDRQIRFIDDMKLSALCSFVNAKLYDLLIINQVIIRKELFL